MLLPNLLNLQNSGFILRMNCQFLEIHLDKDCFIHNTHTEYRSYLIVVSEWLWFNCAFSFHFAEISHATHYTQEVLTYVGGKGNNSLQKMILGSDDAQKRAR